MTFRRHDSSGRSNRLVKRLVWAIATMAVAAVAAGACGSDEAVGVPAATPTSPPAPTATAIATPSPTVVALPTATIAPTATAPPEPTPTATVAPERQQGLLFDYTYAARLLEAGLYEDAIPQFGIVIRRFPEFPKAWYGRGVSYYHEDNLPFALEDLSMAIELDDEYADAYRARGILYKDQGEVDKAVADLEKARSLYSPFRDPFALREVNAALEALGR